MYRFICICLALASPISSFAQQSLLRQYLDIQQQRTGFSGVVLVTKNRQVLHELSTGMASIELNVPMSREAVFNIASISKQFTAMLMLLAADEGRLRLSDPLALYFPALKDSMWRKITLSQLLSHTAGVPHNEGIPGYWTLKSRLPLSTEQALEEIFSMQLLFTPGTDMHYSSPGYFLLARVLEVTFKRPYAALLSEKILRPLEITNAGVNTNGKIIPGMVQGYHLIKDSLTVAPFRDFSLMKGSGDLYASAAALSAWNNSFSGNGTWNDSIQKRLFTPRTGKIPGYGYGWFIRPGKRPAVYHGGGTFGASALSAWYPEENVSIVILSNVSVLPVNELWGDIEKIVFNEKIELPAVKQSISLTAAALQAFAGRYRHADKELRVIFANEQLYVKLGANPAFEIYPEGPQRFYGKKVNGQFTFQTGGTGAVTGLNAEVKGASLHFEKIP